jgi:hypothetical protein
VIRPRIGEANLGAVAGASVAATGGLFAVGIVSAIITQSPSSMFGTPKLALISFLVSGPLGWLLGGQIGPRVGQRWNSPKAEIITGAICGLVPFGLVVLAWYLLAQWLMTRNG